MDVLCTDKTGTLTDGVIALDAAVDPDGGASAEVLRLAYLNAALETGIENPLDAALVAAGEKRRPGHGGLHEDRRDPLRLHPQAPHHRGRDRRRSRAPPDHHEGGVRQCPRRLHDARARGRRGSARRRSARTPRVLLSAEGHGGISRARARDQARAGAANATRQDDEAGMSFAGFLLFLRPAQGPAAQSRPRPRRARRPGQGHHRRQPLCRRPRRRRDRSRSEGHADRRGDRGAAG